MMAVFRLVYLGAAALAGAAGTLVAASLFVPDRAPASDELLAVSIVISAAHFGVGSVFFGIQRHVARIDAALTRAGNPGLPGVVTDVQRLLAYLLSGGALLCLVLGVMVYAMLARIDPGFAVFG
jgi:hypothetical protein